MSKVISKLLWFCIYFTQWLVESSRAIFFNQSKVKPKPIVACLCTFSRALCRLRVTTWSFDWFTGLSPSILIGQRHSFENRSNCVYWFLWCNCISYCTQNARIEYKYSTILYSLVIVHLVTAQYRTDLISFRWQTFLVVYNSLAKNLVRKSWIINILLDVLVCTCMQYRWVFWLTKQAPQNTA